MAIIVSLRYYVDVVTVVGVAIEHGGGVCVMVSKFHAAMCPCALCVSGGGRKRDGITFPFPGQ